MDEVGSQYGVGRRLPRWDEDGVSESQFEWLGNNTDNSLLCRNDCPHPLSDGDDVDDLVPVPPPAHFSEPRKMDEFSGLVMNIVLPAAPVEGRKYPVFLYVHGGSLLYGGANLPIFDGVNLVSHSLAINRPVVCVNFNYRVGLGGFLASQAIKDELRADGYEGCGNFGFTDQHVAFDWVQKYIGQLGGDPNEVTAIGESAGGISISNQLVAAKPPVFHRAVCMSGLAAGIPPWTMEQHEELFQAVCRHFNIDPSAADVLDQLRAIPQQVLANATPSIQGVLAGTGNPCMDGWFYAEGIDPREVQPPPQWLRSFMLGDVYHEGIIFHINLLEDSYDLIRNILLEYVKDQDELNTILTAYNVTPELDHNLLLERVEHMVGDAVFKVINYATMLVSKEFREQKKLWTYHFDQRSCVKNSLEGTAYHAHELLYLFGNLDNELNEAERYMARDFAAAWIRFVYGEAPWEVEQVPEEGWKWKVWGPDSAQAVKTEEEDETARSYTRIKKLLSMGNGETWKRWFKGSDALVNKRMRMGKGISSTV